jgi:phytoene dehydrogenase-like protein
MGYIDQTILKSFFAANSWLTDQANIDDQAAVLKQIDDIIFQYTKVPTPADPSQAVPTLQNIACSLFVWFTSGVQGKLDETEYKRRKDLYTDAMGELQKILNGTLGIYSGNSQVSRSISASSDFRSNRKITDMI